MSWRIIFVSNEARISLRNKNLLITQDEEVSVPLEDIGVILLENERILLSLALLNACVAHKITLFICDKAHLPSGLLFPYQQHSRQLKITEMQLSLAEPFKKRTWQKIVRQKIQNQKIVAEEITGDLHEEFNSLIFSVNSGDTMNKEATAAQKYFSLLFEKGITRRANTKINAALNYGYAIIRGVVARNVAGYGFLSSLGVHHASELNNFNLADDFMEPYRPVVDYFVFSGEVLDENEETELSKMERTRLIDILTKEVKIADSRYSVLYSVEMMVKSFHTACENKDPELLLLPNMIFSENDKQIYETRRDVRSPNRNEEE